MTRPRLIILLRCVTLVSLCVFTDFGLYLLASFAMAPLGLFMPVFAVDCTIFSDDFSTDRTGTADYSIIVGTWTVSGGELSTGTTGAELKETIGSSSITNSGTCSVNGKVDTSGGAFRLLGSYNTANEYIFAEVTINGASSTFKLWYRGAGINTQIGSTYTFTGSTGTYYPVKVCWTSSGFNVTTTATFNGGESVISGTAFVTQTNLCGLHARPNSGTVTFDDFLFIKHQVEDAACPTC